MAPQMDLSTLGRLSGLFCRPTTATPLCQWPVTECVSLTRSVAAVIVTAASMTYINTKSNSTKAPLDVSIVTDMTGNE